MLPGEVAAAATAAGCGTPPPASPAVAGGGEALSVSSPTPGGAGLPTFDELVATPSPVRRQLEALRQEGAAGMAAAAEEAVAALAVAQEGVATGGGHADRGACASWSGGGGGNVEDDGPAATGAGGGDGGVACGGGGWDGGWGRSSVERTPRGGSRTASLLAKFTRPRERESRRAARRPRHGTSAAPLPRGGGRADELDEDLEWTLRSSSTFAGVENLV